jgi:ribonuclease HI
MKPAPIIASTGQLPPTDKAILVYVDGGCNLQDYGVGAWTFAYTLPGETIDKVKLQSGGVIGTTNNRMELMAVIQALETVEIGPRVIITSDSQYVVNGCTVWCRNWMANGWKTADGKPVKNRDLWERLYALCSLHNVRFDWTKGHAGNPMNEMCDMACVKTMLQTLTDKAAGKLVVMDHHEA